MQPRSRPDLFARSFARATQHCTQFKEYGNAPGHMASGKTTPFSKPSSQALRISHGSVFLPPARQRHLPDAAN